MCIHLFLIPIKTYADPDIIKTTPAIDKPGVILGLSGRGSSWIVLVPFVALFPAVGVKVCVALAVDVSTLGVVVVLESRVELEVNNVEGADWMRLAERAAGPAGELVVDRLRRGGNPLLWRLLVEDAAEGLALNDGVVPGCRGPKAVAFAVHMHRRRHVETHDTPIVRRILYCARRARPSHP